VQGMVKVHLAQRHKGHGNQLITVGVRRTPTGHPEDNLWQDERKAVNA